MTVLQRVVMRIKRGTTFKTCSRVQLTAKTHIVMPIASYDSQSRGWKRKTALECWQPGASGPSPLL